ncbi:hypothetical protein MNR02_14845 [Shinella sp. H4-D48]|uniref:hypothetical protein n=1 Tax=Shinella sp. H4-D48 TaxID=2925841 RepID=UPI001F534A17|nr:hypothetical protein [Shinella sp. H4-D48]UNK37726.1 hypothetical protein MNR02_14845 [Shinella sp. H4-D48]
MISEKKPENLLAEIAYSKKRVHASYYKEGKFTHADENASIVGDLAPDDVQNIVLDVVQNLLSGRKCGVIVQPRRRSRPRAPVRILVFDARGS